MTNPSKFDREGASGSGPKATSDENEVQTPSRPLQTRANGLLGDVETSDSVYDLTLIPLPGQNWERFRAIYGRLPRLGVEAAGYILHPPMDQVRLDYLEELEAEGKPHGGRTTAFPDGCECWDCERWFSQMRELRRLEPNYFVDPLWPHPIEPGEHPCTNCGELAGPERALCDLCWNEQPVEILRGEQ